MRCETLDGFAPSVKVFHCPSLGKTRMFQDNAEIIVRSGHLCRPRPGRDFSFEVRRQIITAANRTVVSDNVILDVLIGQPIVIHQGQIPEMDVSINEVSRNHLDLSISKKKENRSSA